MDTPPETESTTDRARRVIKRYSNRKLYDTKDSRYVTLLQIAELVRSGEEVQIIDNNSKEDLTEVTLAQIIYEEQKAHSRNVPLQTLKALIHQRTEQVLTELREGPIGRLIPGLGGDGSPPDRGDRAEKSDGAAKKGEPEAARGPSLVDQAKEKLEDWQHHIDDRVKAVLPNILHSGAGPWHQLELEVKRLTERVAQLEALVEAARRGSPR